MSAALAAAVLFWPTAAAADPLDRWASEIAEASARFAIPEEWIRRVVRAESGGRAVIGGAPVVSRAGAMGLMQLMPGTWSDMHALLGLGPDPQDPRDNILAGTAYLRSLYDRFGYPGLFAAYNAGPARYSAFLAGRRALPEETRSYAAALERPAQRRPEPPQRRASVAAIFAIEQTRTPSEGRALPPGLAAPLFVALGGSSR
jgi:soluble lytic murein transglycosylase-like protein